MFTFRDGVESAMDDEAAARKLTLALAGRAKNVAPALARNLDLAGTKVLLDVGGGTGIYSLALLRANPPAGGRLGPAGRAEGRPRVRRRTRVARPGRAAAGRHVRRPVPAGSDAILVSNILHDWDAPECRTLVRRLAAALPAGGRLLVTTCS
jgi:hypothetical protein